MASTSFARPVNPERRREASGTSIASSHLAKLPFVPPPWRRRGVPGPRRIHGASPVPIWRAHRGARL